MITSLTALDRRLSLFAEAIAGRPIHVKALAEGDGALAQDRDSVYVPDALDWFDSHAHNAGAYRVIVLHQLGYREFGTFAFTAAEAERRLDRALPGATRRGSDFERFHAGQADAALSRLLFGIVEGLRIDLCTLRAYPGIAAHHARVALRERERLTGDTGDAALPYLIGLLRRFALGAPAADLVIEDPTGLAGALLAAVRRITADADVYDSAAAAATCTAILHGAGFAVATADDADDAAADERALAADVPFDSLQRDNRLERWQAELDDGQRPLGGGESADDARPGDGEYSREPGLGGDRSEREQLARRIDMERADLRHTLGAGVPRGRSFLYDEWDHLANRYRPGYCRLYEQRLHPDGARAWLTPHLMPHVRAIRRRFERLRPLGFERRRRVTDGESLDLEALIEARVDRHRDGLVDDAVYARRERRQRDIAAAFLVDLSASTDDPIRSSEPMPAARVTAGAPNLRDPFDDDAVADDPADTEPKRRVVDVLREAVLLMGAALEQLGDACGIYGFSGYAHDGVEFYVAKGPNEPFGARSQAAIAAMQPKRSTRMGPAIRHGVRRLRQTPAALRVLIVLSDGFPQDCDYGPERGDHEYGIADTAKALREAQALGIETFCLTVDPSGHDYLKRMCPDERYMVIDEIERLPDALGKVYLTLTRGR